MIKIFPLPLRNPKIHLRLHKSLIYDPILIQFNPVYIFETSFPRIYLNITLSSMPVTPRWSPTRFSDQN